MSNLIKASQISYAQTVRPLDMNGRAEAIQKQYMDKYFEENFAAKQIDFEEVSRKLEEQRVITPDDVEFTPGIVSEQVFVEEGENEEPNEALDVEYRLMEKRKEIKQAEQRMAEVRAEADSILEDARRQVEEMLEQARAEAEAEKAAIYEAAQNEGYTAGMEKAEQQARQKEAELEAVQDQYREEYEKQVDELEPAFVELVVRFVRKLTGIYAEDKREIILHLIDNAMKDKHGENSFIIRVSEADYAMAVYTKDTVRGYLSEDATVEVVADKLLSKNQCMIETESRIFDCSLDGQMLSLIEDIRLLAEKD